ncbi:MAG: glycoside hydrolase family 88 protein, partial [Clostridia bacterium]|nr:glycoside hydrolase family 88 protein [Clostridia bacterium]
MGIYEKIISDNQKFIDEIWGRIVSKMDVASERNRNKLPFIQTDGAYDDMAQNYPEAWTNGFWPGMMWLLYVGTQNEKYKEIARCGAEFLEKCADDFDLLHHDVGFMWNISTGADWRITGDKKAKSRTMYMAASLASRYNMNTGCIRAWAEEARESMVIIDSMMNISLLYLASKET